MKILIYGGSFNPPHMGHVRSVRAAAEAIRPDKVFLIPAAVPPHKELPEGSATAEQRLAMTELAAREIPGSEVLDLELHRAGKSYTVDTLRTLRAENPEAELVFLLGTDMFLTLDEWREPETIVSLCTIALFPRETDRVEAIEGKRRELEERYKTSFLVLPGNPVEVSSTELRAALKERGGRENIPEPVYAYIIRNRLYGARPDFVWLRREAYTYLKPKRVPHVQGTEQEAVRLAKRWGLPEEDAATAAICHDITKRLDLSEQLRLCARYGIMADDYEKVSEKLLHAKTGAAFAKELFGLPEHIAEAIRWHTTGRAGMDTMQQIIYLADYIEPTRSGFDGLAELRQAAYEDLDAAMELGLRMSLDDVITRGNEPHDDSIRAERWFLTKLHEKGKKPIRAQGIPEPKDLGI